MEDEKCDHPRESWITVYDHNKCDRCGAIKTDSMWGLASNIWFKNLEEANYYKDHGRYPEKTRDC